MTKKSLIVASLLLIGTNTFAKNEYFIGLGVGNSTWSKEKTQVRPKNKAPSTSLDRSNNGSVKSIAGGTIIKDKHKLTILFSSYNTDSSYTQMSSIGLNYTYVMNATSKTWKPFVSLGISKDTYTEEADPSLGLKRISLTTYPLMLGLGVDYEIDKQHFMTMQYDMGVETTDLAGDSIITLDQLNRWLISYNYKF